MSVEFQRQPQKSERVKITKAILFVGALLLATILPAQAQTLDVTAKGRIEFQSFTPKSMFDLARERRRNWEEQTVWGDLSFPSKSMEKVPVMVLMHGSAGVGRAMSQWVDAFNDIGVATFVVDSFGPRGIATTVDDQERLPTAANLMDAFAALQILASHPRIDSKRIGVMGFSKGGEVAFRSAVEPLRAAVIKTDLRFALHIPTYAGCNQVYWSPNITKAPMLNLVGADDDYAMAAPCEALAKRYEEAGAPIRTIVYEGAGHAWDSMGKVYWSPEATTASSCGVVRWDIETWDITAQRTQQHFTGDAIAAYFQTCSHRGVHYGRNERAFRKSREDAQAFVKSVFF
jgi:dienelactone hydrolase